MSNRYSKFLTELADLMDKYDVTMCGRDDDVDYYPNVDGITVEFNTLSDGIDGPDNRRYREIKLGRSNYDITPDVVRKKAEEQ